MSNNLRINNDIEGIVFDGDLLFRDNKELLAKDSDLLAQTMERRARYWCFRYQKEVTHGVTSDDGPAGFKEFVESLPGFTKWEAFADTWDLWLNPKNLSFAIARRVLSVWKEWDHIMDRVAIPIDASPEERALIEESLEKDYARRNGG